MNQFLAADWTDSRLQIIQTDIKLYTLTSNATVPNTEAFSSSPWLSDRLFTPSYHGYAATLGDGSYKLPLFLSLWHKSGDFLHVFTFRLKPTVNVSPHKYCVWVGYISLHKMRITPPLKIVPDKVTVSSCLLKTQLFDEITDETIDLCFQPVRPELLFGMHFFLFLFAIWGQ